MHSTHSQKLPKPMSAVYIVWIPPNFLLLIRSPNGPYLPKKYESAKVCLKKMFECLGEWYKLTDLTFKIMKINHFGNN